MKDLVFLVEGETETEFVNRILIPYLVSRGLNSSMYPIKITMSGGGHGFNNIEHFKNTIRPVLYQNNEPIITTMIDHYGINSEQKLPGYAECILETDANNRISKMQTKLNNVVQSIKKYPFFVPYIQRHEMETLLFANPNDGFDLEEISIRDRIVELCNKFGSIEDINCTPEGAPSKRIDEIYKLNGKKYAKVVDAIDIAELTGIEAMLDKCPHFKSWIEELIKVVTTP